MVTQSARRLFGALLAASAFAGASPAFAGQCTAEGANALAGAPTAPKAVTDDVLGSIDLGPEIQVADRQLRMRKLVVQPGGIVPLHSHGDRPALILTVSGSIKEYRSTCTQPIVHAAGDLTREAEGISHYWVNDGKVPAVLYSADVHHGM
ncbi:cupin [Sphingomonas sp. ID1715]|uniref:cupin domain-containing protein n=1 Tax=Sphingomonas sp. ID1715 TaxID=1656898 RepID=UPI001488D5A5|nr:cupin domain-containing protein [Sphingomonas sp. ID1715]NNM76477.1 cupin [Sphingomonas sp. ID1715]